MGDNADLKPLFKWTGGKRREIKFFSDYYPDFIKKGEKYTYVEPFMGGGAVFWSLNNLAGHNVVSDFDKDLVNFYRQVREQDPEFIDSVRSVSDLWKDKNADNYEQRSAAYYRFRNLDRNNGLSSISDAQRAARFYIVNQLSFSGMRRFNSKGEFNVPFGHYKNFNSSIITSQAHVDLLNRTDIHNRDYKDVVLENDHENTFIYLDPPYTRVMKKYSHEGEFEEDKQRELAEVLKSLKNASFMVVIDKSPLTMELYGDYVEHSYELSYGVNIKNRFSQATEHIVAINYQPSEELREENVSQQAQASSLFDI